MTYKPPYSITPKILNVLSDIMKHIGEINVKQGFDHKPKLRRSNQINSIYSSLAIENNQLSKEQVTDIINGKLVIGPKRDIVEVQNALKCYDDILVINPFSINDLLKYHGMMMDGLIDDAGTLRKREEGVYDGDQVIFIAPPFERIGNLLESLFEYLNDSEDHFIIKSCVFHYEFEFIHPFSDGNGRIGRLFQTCLLASKEKVFAYLPIESMIKKHQKEYYEAIALSNQNGNSTVFIEYMLDIILETITNVIKSSSVELNHYSIQVKKLLSIMKDDVPYTTRELMDLLKISSRASFKKNYLDPCLELGIVQMTIPDKPSSRNQRYLRTHV